MMMIIIIIKQEHFYFFNFIQKEKIEKKDEVNENIYKTRLLKKVCKDVMFLMYVMHSRCLT